MKERPILFSGPMVRAILEGRKTQTRRVMKFPPPEGIHAGEIRVEHYNPTIVDKYDDEQPGPEIFGAFDTYGEWGTKCPYGQPGDRLWVRETFQPLYAEFEKPGDYETGEGYAVKYPASDPVEEYLDTNSDSITSRCKPSIHMPRWASRISLEITNVRAERLNEISDEDAMAEGQGEAFGPGAFYRTFSSFWESINGVNSWAANPWVWVVEFKRVES